MLIPNNALTRVLSQEGYELAFELANPKFDGIFTLETVATNLSQQPVLIGQTVSPLKISSIPLDNFVATAQRCTSYFKDNRSIIISLANLCAVSKREKIITTIIQNVKATQQRMVAAVAKVKDTAIPKVVKNQITGQITSGFNDAIAKLQDIEKSVTYPKPAPVSRLPLIKTIATGILNTSIYGYMAVAALNGELSFSADIVPLVFALDAIQGITGLPLGVPAAVSTLCQIAKKTLLLPAYHYPMQAAAVVGAGVAAVGAFTGIAAVGASIGANATVEALANATRP